MNYCSLAWFLDKSIMLVSLFLSFYYWTNLFSLLFSLWNSSAIIVTWFKFRTSFKRLLLRVSFLKIFHWEVLFLGILVFIFPLLIFDLFVHVNRIIIHWSWNLSSGVFEIFLWDVFKSDIHICLPCGFMEGRGEGAGWVFILDCINLLLWLIKKSFKFCLSEFFCWVFTCVYCF